MSSIAVGAICLLPGGTGANAASIVIDLTSAGNSGTINGAVYEQIDPQATGTGTIDAFVQQSPQGSGTTSQAYNTTVNNVLDNKSSDIHNHSISLSDVPLVLRDNTLYRQFLLDVNENSGNDNEFVSLDEVQIFVGGTANSSVTTFTSGILDHDGTLVYQMDAGGDSWVALNSTLNSGSGSGDMYLYIPETSFTGFASTDVVTLYSVFGLQGEDPPGFTGDFGMVAGFEEWAVIAENAIPEPSSVAIALLGMVTGIGYGWRVRHN